MLFGQVAGHARQRELLARAVAGGRVHPALLFAGPAGVGKRLVAGELARAWLCLEEGSEPCGRCRSCAVGAGGAHADLRAVGLDEKRKSIGVDAARALGSWLGESPAWGRRKAAVVDPADALTVEAANALLKTLEQPPQGRVVVLVAEKAGALPATVRSRCQLVSFGTLADEDVAQVLRRAGWPPQAARQAAALAEGSPGRALARDAKLSQEADEGVRALLEALGRGERGAALAFAEGLGESRERVLAALQSLAGLLRQAARSRLGAAAAADALPGRLAELGAEQTQRLLGLALETHRRLAGDRPPNAKLALSTLLLGAGQGLVGTVGAPAGAAAGGGRR